MNRKIETYRKLSADAIAQECSPAHIANLISDMQADIVALHDAMQALVEAVRAWSEAVDRNTGYEPSQSVYFRALDNLGEALARLDAIKEKQP